ncbi:MAG: 16S rRNA (uracil(1498)-N(3))-methyltransferase [Candidatus Omnitrophota bacterium]
MSRFYVPKECVKDGNILVEGDEARHILKVMRLKEGDGVVVFDGTGCEYSGFIKDADERNNRAIVEIVKEERPPKEAAAEIILAQAIPKRKKMDWIIEKATELGVSRIIPMISERTIVRPNDQRKMDDKAERWRKIAREASKQCGRTDVPRIEDLTLYGQVTAHMDEYDLALMACLEEDRVSLKSAIKNIKSGKIIVFIGPEGDFTREELVMADKDNCRFISLGKRVLKSDTAGLFVLSALAYEMGI